MRRGEAELRAALAMAQPDGPGRAARKTAKLILAAILAGQGRRGEAQMVAAEFCGTAKKDPARVFIDKAKLCV